MARRRRRNYWQLHDKEWLIDHYWNKHLSTDDIGDIIGCSRGSVVYIAMHRLEIRTRNLSEAKALSNTNIHIPKEELFDLYWEQDLNLNEIGKIYKCDPTTIHNILVRYGIKIKTYYEARKKSDWSVNIPKEELERLYCIENWGIEKISEHFHCAGATVFRNMVIYGIPRRPSAIAKYATRALSKELLEDLYWNQELGLSQIGEKLGYGTQTIKEHMVKYNIPRRTRSEVTDGENNPFFGKKHTKETLDKISGKNAPNWRGGRSFEPYCPKFNEQLKEHIREKWGRRCVLCGRSEKEIMDEMRAKGWKRIYRLAIHHVDYNKNCGCDGSVCILIPLCHSCHGKTCHDYEYWEELIREKISGEYTEDPQKALKSPYFAGI